MTDTQHDAVWMGRVALELADMLEATVSLLAEIVTVHAPVLPIGEVERCRKTVTEMTDGLQRILDQVKP
jgi:hypothetical protein